MRSTLLATALGIAFVSMTKAEPPSLPADPAPPQAPHIQAVNAPVPDDQRFSLLWLSGSTPHRAAIRGDGSIRDTDDSGLVVTRISVGQYCIKATSPSEGAVGVLQDDGAGTHGTISVTMGITNPCSSVPGAQIFVQTWQVP